MDAAAGDHYPPTSTQPPPPELAMVARAVQRIVARSDALAAMSGGGGGGAGRERGLKGMAAFEAAQGATAPRIGLAEYLERVHRYAGLEPECYVVAYVYIDMAAHRRPAAAVASTNVHRLLLACLLVASKFLDDFHHSNAFFARVGGVSNAEMNKLELELLGLLDFEVAVDHRAYGRYREHLEKEMHREQKSVNGGGGGRARGAASVVFRPPLPPLAEERSACSAEAAAAAAGHEHEYQRLPNGVPVLPAAARTSLRDLWSPDY